MLTSYHNHTTWSDGKATLAEQMAAAEQAGLDEIGISDHYVPSPYALIDWSMPLDRLGEYVAALQDAAGNSAALQLRIGLEADYFPETVAALRDEIARYPFDYVIGSVHFANGFPIDKAASFWDELSPEARDRTWRLYWQRIVEMAESGVYDFVAHLDLPKKFGHRPQANLTPETTAALDALANAGMGIEINTAGWSLPAREAYPALDLLRQAGRRGIPLLINADAHRADHLTRDFERARALAREAGYTQLVRYQARRPIPYSF
jgi:histidinol-phosphatase (PHP family)